MPPYDGASFDPPAPVARVVLRNREDGTQWVDVPMLIDSGADVTIIPATATQQLGVRPTPNRQYELMGFDGSIRTVPTVEVDLILFGRTYRGQFLLLEQEWGILGRNILNTLRLVLDGPRLEWGILHKRSQQESGPPDLDR